LLVNPDSMPAQSDWMEINRLPVTQFYDLAVAPRNPNLVFGATQDNGVSRYGGTLNWDNLGRCGDATGVVIDPVIPSIVYARCWNGFDESLDGGNPGGGRAVASIRQICSGRRRLAFSPGPLILFTPAAR